MKIIVLASISVLTLAIVTGVVVQETSIDGLWGFIASLHYGDDTQYAPGYSDKAFRKVKVGMPEAEVKKLLGKPLSVALPDKDFDFTVLRYSLSPHSKRFRFRNIILSNGVVERTFVGFF